MARFGCPNRIVTDNAASFKVEPLIKFCEQFGITLIHSTVGNITERGGKLVIYIYI